MSPENKGVPLSEMKIIRLLALVAGILILLDMVGQTFTFFTGHDVLRGLLPMIDLNRENNLGTLFSVLLMVGGAVLFWVAGAIQKGQDKAFAAWFLMAAVFGFLALDDFAAIHERLVDPLRELIGTSGLLFYAWILPYGAFVMALAVLVGPAVLRLRPDLRRLFFISAGLFLTGAVAFEALGGWWYEKMGRGTPGRIFVFDLMTTVEESLELAGLILLILALLRLIRWFGGERRIYLTD